MTTLELRPFTIFTLTICILSAASSFAEDEKKVSETLSKAVDALAAQATELVSANATRDEIKMTRLVGVSQDALNKLMVEKCKDSISVTAEEEAKFKRGDFDDNANREKWRQLIAELRNPKDWAKGDLPLPVKLMLENNKKNSGKEPVESGLGLKGANLELAVRIIRPLIKKWDVKEIESAK